MDEEIVNKLKAAQCIEKLPSKGLLEQVETLEQLLLFCLYRQRGKQVSEVLKSLFLDTANPLKPLLKTKEIARSDYNCIWHEARMYARLWDLIKVSSGHLQAALEEHAGGYRFKSDLQLFAACAYEMVNSDFSVWFEKYREFPKTQLVKSYRLRAKEYTGQVSAKEQEFLDKLPTPKGYLWLDLLLLVCLLYMTKQRTPLRTAYEDFEKAMADFLEVTATHINSGKSLVVKNGHVGIGRKNGGTYDFA